MNNQYAVVVELDLYPQSAGQFLDLVIENARASREEEGCHIFEVLVEEHKPDSILLYEVYANQAAFELHCISSHYLSFDAATADMVTRKHVRRYAFPESGRP